MAFLTLEDTSGAVEVVVFPETFAKSAHLFAGDDPIVVQGILKKEERGAKIIADCLDTIEEARTKYTSGATILLHAAGLSRTKLEGLKKNILQFHGPCPVSLTLHFDGRGEVDIETTGDLTVRPGREFSRVVEQTLGYAAVHYLKTKAEVKQRNGGPGNWQKKGREE
jgi:DNA polymerase-3 subunit alpha